MRVRVLGGGVYGTHLTLALAEDGYDVELHEIAPRLFAGASGNQPARLHQGFHYCRSKLTRAACQEHFAEFMARYGHLTHGVPVNVYAVAEHESLLDFGTYKQILRDEIEFVTVESVTSVSSAKEVTVERPAELGLRNVEGAILTGERHFIVDRAREHFTKALGNRVIYNQPPGEVDDPRWDVTVDCTFCAHDSIGIDRFEACLTVLLEGPTDRAVTVMDGPFGSIYPWDESQGLSSLTSAKWTPLARTPTWGAARVFLDGPTAKDAVAECSRGMFAQMVSFYPRIRDEYRIVDHRLAIRAMPRSAADARLVDVVRIGDRALRVRAGKLDAIFHAERVIRDMLREFE